MEPIIIASALGRFYRAMIAISKTQIMNRWAMQKLKLCLINRIITPSTNMLIECLWYYNKMKYNDRPQVPNKAHTYVCL